MSEAYTPSRITDEVISLVYLHGESKNDYKHDIFYEYNLGEIRLEAYADTTDRYSKKYKPSSLKISQGPLEVVYEAGKVQPKTMIARRDDGTTIDVLGVKGPWENALQLVIAALRTWTENCPAKDKLCKDPTDVQLRRAEMIFEPMELPAKAPIGFQTTPESLITRLLDVIERENIEGPLVIEDELNIHYNKDRYGDSLTFSDSNVKISYYFSRDSYTKLADRKWKLSSLNVFAEDTDIAIPSGSPGLWHNYVAYKVFARIQAWLETQLSPEEYAKRQREKELAEAAELFADFLPKTEQDNTEIAPSDSAEQDLVSGRDFLARQLKVDKVPEPSNVKAHTVRGRLRKLTGKS